MLRSAMFMIGTNAVTMFIWVRGGYSEHSSI